jgi:hypothetical protein
MFDLCLGLWAQRITFANSAARIRYCSAVGDAGSGLADFCLSSLTTGILSLRRRAMGGFPL